MFEFSSLERRRMRCGTLALCLLIAWIQTLDVARAENAVRKNVIPAAAERGFVATKGSVDLQSATADDGYVSSPTSKTASEMEPDGAVEAPRADEDPSKANVLASTNAARPHASELSAPQHDPVKPVPPVETASPSTADTDPSEQPGSPERELVVITLVGDTGLNAHRQRVRADKAVRHGSAYDWSWTTKHVAPLIDGHLNFANIETVVTARNSLSPSSKLFNFRMHPNAARHLVDIGFNLFSLANNHAADYGRAGILDTLKHSDALKYSGLRAHAGLGRDRSEALATKTLSVGRVRVGFAAMGIGAASPGVSRAGPGKPGQGNIYKDPDLGETIDGLAAADVDYRILSMHFGTERNVFPSASQVRRWRDEIAVDRNVDLIVGHHSHVAQGLQQVGGKLILYGLGNFLHLGTADMGKFNSCRDYGLLVRIFIVREPDGTTTAQAVQVVPLTDMHLQPKPLIGKAAGRRIDFLNALATKLDDETTGSQGVRFAKQLDGSGLFCAADAKDGPGRLGSLCQDFTPARLFTSAERRRLLGMCGAAPRVSSNRSSKKQRRVRKQKRVKVWTGADVFDKR